MDDQINSTDENLQNDISQDTEATQGDNQAIVLLHLESLIKSHITGIEKLQEELKKQREMMESIFENDSTFVDHSEKAKEATRVKSTTRQEILKRPSVLQVSEKIKSMKSEMRELQSTLSDYLKEYQRMSGLNEIEDDEGQLREIVSTAKLVKRGGKIK